MLNPFSTDVHVIEAGINQYLDIPGLHADVCSDQFNLDELIALAKERGCRAVILHYDNVVALYA